MKQSTVIPAMVQRLFFDMIKQRYRKYATPPPWKQFYVFLATAPTSVLTVGTNTFTTTNLVVVKVLHIYGRVG